MIYVYLAAIVAANLIIAQFGPSASIVTAFALIGLDLTVRDRLHDRWQGQALALRMGALIAAGSVLTYAINAGAGQVALASVLAFAVAAAGDAGAYHWLRDRAWLRRVNGSNAIGAALDSLIFPTVAFGALMPEIVAGQFLAKLLGGFVWSLVLAWLSTPKDVAQPARS